ncbi:MAG TPA: c-type cytochrome [Desulfuromonadales bacterium]|nr:c-type cytochrome [Desulfuromonadales bacterium]
MTRSLLLKVVLLLLVTTPAVGEPREDPPSTRPRESELPPTTEALTGDGRKSVLAEGETVYRRVCVRCHDKGISGAPKLGDREAWKVRIPTGLNNLVRNAIKGYQGNQGVHPPRGGDRNLSDVQIGEAVRFMVESCKKDPARR